MANVRWIVGVLWILVVSLALFVFVPLGIYELHAKHQQPYVIAWFIGGVFVLLAVPWSIFDIAWHLIHWHNPGLQRKIIRIQWMVPIYAINSWLALRFIGVGIYLDTARECYEAYVIYNFYAYLLEYLRQRKTFDLELTRRPPQKHIFPLCCFRPIPMGQGFIDMCTHGVTSYIVVRPLVTLVAFACELGGKLGEGQIRTDRAYPYLAFITNCSQAWAMYCLVLFYLAFKKDLVDIHPFGKFATIKAVVFFSFWQSIGIAILVKAKVIHNDGTWTYFTSESVAGGIQDFLICVEMFIAAAVHHRVFSYKEHLTDEDPGTMTFMQAVRVLFDVRDVQEGVVDHLAAVSTLGQKGRTDRQPLLSAQGSSDTSLAYGSQTVQGAEPSLHSGAPPESDV